MTDIKDNPPPMPMGKGLANRLWQEFHTSSQVRQIEAAAFERGKAAVQGEIEFPDDVVNDAELPVLRDWLEKLEHGNSDDVERHIRAIVCAAILKEKK